MVDGEELLLRDLAVQRRQVGFYSCVQCCRATAIGILADVSKGDRVNAKADTCRFVRVDFETPKVGNAKSGRSQKWEKWEKSEVGKVSQVGRCNGGLPQRLHPS
jgi:hypothetical protein